MKHTLHLLLVAFAALWLAAPTTGNEGGENAGGTGVWILPACASIGQPGVDLTRSVANLEKDVILRVPQSLGAVVATACDPLTGLLVPLPVAGRDVKLAGSLMVAYREANVRTIELAIVNEQLDGYRIRLDIGSGGAASSLTIH